MSAGVIRDLERQCRYPVYWPGQPQRKESLLLTYVCDFRYTDVATGKQIVEDVKGKILGEFRLKAKAVFFAYGIKVHIVTRKRTGGRYLWFFDRDPEPKAYEKEKKDG